MSQNDRNEALWRLAVEIEAKENAPASQRDCSEVQELRKRFDGHVRQKPQEEKACEQRIKNTYKGSASLNLLDT